MKRFLSGVVFGAVIALASMQSPRAAIIAVTDSGTDIQHPELSGKIWNNPGEIDDGVDNDDNGYIDDLHGWNFIDNDDRLINRKLIGTFPQDDYKYFEIQTKYLLGQATPEEIAWIKAKIADQNFVAGLEAFGEFVHGTHVAGVSAKDTDSARIMVLKMIGQKATAEQVFFGAVLNAPESIRGAIDPTKEKLIKLGLYALAQVQGQGVAPEGQYLSEEHAQVVNCSWGASRAAIEPIIKPLIEKVLGGSISDADLHMFADYFLSETGAAMKKTFIDPSPHALFVVAAGNDGANNDQVATAPANARAPNELVVAATLDRASLAVFSNYGAVSVDVAAPGVGILSTIPGDYTHGAMPMMQLSGTSQATPYVSNIASRVLDANAKLGPADVKKIIMDTVDKKDFLKGKVVSGGIANLNRALTAAELSRSMPLDAAIQRAIAQVGDELVSRVFIGQQPLDAAKYVLPLPSFIH